MYVPQKNKITKIVGYLLELTSKELSGGKYIKLILPLQVLFQAKF